MTDKLGVFVNYLLGYASRKIDHGFCGTARRIPLFRANPIFGEWDQPEPSEYEWWCEVEYPQIPREPMVFLGEPVSLDITFEDGRNFGLEGYVGNGGTIHINDVCELTAPSKCHE